MKSLILIVSIVFAGLGISASPTLAGDYLCLKIPDVQSEGECDVLCGAATTAIGEERYIGETLDPETGICSCFCSKPDFTPPVRKRRIPT